MCVHALHAVHALLDLRVAGGPLGGVSPCAVVGSMWMIQLQSRQGCEMGLLTVAKLGAEC